MEAFPPIQHRREFGDILNQLGLTNSGVEIGVNQGRNAAVLLNRWKGRILHLVDPWRKLDGYDDVVNENDREADFRKAWARLAPFSGRFAIWRMLSSEAADLFAAGSQDFVYIDADHSYEGCLSDIRAWWPIVRSGGVLAGHDYHEQPRVKVPRGWLNCGVKQAVTEFFSPLGLSPTISSDLVWDAKGACREAPSWFVRKP